MRGDVHAHWSSKAQLILIPEAREQLESIVASRTLSSALVTRARIVLFSHAGLANTEIARKVGLSNPSVGKWRQRFIRLGVEGMHDELRTSLHTHLG